MYENNPYQNDGASGAKNHLNADDHAPIQRLHNAIDQLSIILSARQNTPNGQYERALDFIDQALKKLEGLESQLVAATQQPKQDKDSDLGDKEGGNEHG